MRCALGAVCATSRSHLNRIKDDPDDDDDIDITSWIPDLEDMIARQQADPSLVSPVGFSLEYGDGVEPGSPSALAAASAPRVGFDVADPGRMSVSSAGGDYDQGELPQPPPMPAAAAAGSGPPVPVPAVGAAGASQDVRCTCCSSLLHILRSLQSKRNPYTATSEKSIELLCALGACYLRMLFGIDWQRPSRNGW
jgi:hypothetical protein